MYYFIDSEIIKFSEVLNCLRRLKELRDTVAELETGRLPDHVQIGGTDESPEVSRKPGNLTESLQSKNEFAENPEANIELIASFTYSRKNYLKQNIKVCEGPREKQSNEITRANIKIKSFSEAMDKAYSGVIRRTSPAGEEVRLMSSFKPVQDGNGTVMKVIFPGQGITERKLKYRLLEEANREIKRLRRQADEES